MAGLRELKRDRTRQALLSAAALLFRNKGFESTTTNEIAAAAEVAPRTFFRYFATKDELLFPDAAERIQRAIDAIRAAGGDADPLEVLQKAVHSVGFPHADRADGLADLRLRLMEQVPSVAGQAYRFQAEAEQAIAAELVAAFPGRFTPVTAAAIVGSLIGAATAATRAALRTKPDTGPEELQRTIFDALQTALERR